MRGVLYSFLTLLVVILVIVYFAFFGIKFFGGSDPVETSMTEKIYTMDNALSAAKLYAETGLRYSVYQGCFDTLKDVDYLYYGEAEFLNELKRGIKNNMDKYTGPDYSFLQNNRVTLPGYHFIDVIPHPLPQAVLAPDYNVQVSFVLPDGVKPDYKEFSLEEIKEILQRVTVSGDPLDIDEFALFHAFSEFPEFLDQATIYSVTVDLNSDKLEESRQLIASGIIHDALSKFKPSFVDTHVKSVHVLNDMELFVQGNYLFNGKQEFGNKIKGFKSFSSQGDIFIDYMTLVNEGPKAIYKEIANIISLNYDTKDWAVQPNKDPKQELADIITVLLYGGKELRDLKALAEADIQSGSYVLADKLHRAEILVNKNLIVSQILEKIQSVLEFYSAEGAKLVEFASDKLSVINSQRSGPDMYSKLSVIATSPDNLEISQNVNTTRISVQRSPDIEEEVATHCFSIFLAGKEQFGDITNQITADIDDQVKDYPHEGAEAQLPGTSPDSCETVFSDNTGKTITEAEAEISDRIEDTVSGLSMHLSQGFTMSAEVIENLVLVKGSLVSSVSSSGGKTVTCDFDYHANATVTVEVEGVKSDQKFPVRDDGEIVFRPLSLEFPVKTEYSNPVPRQTI